LHSLKRYTEAKEAFQKGFQLEPGSEAMKKGVEDAEKMVKWEEDMKKREESAQGQLKKLQKYFEGDVLGRCRLMEEVKHLVDDVEFVKIVSEIQDDPKKLQNYLGHERVLSYVQVASQYDYLSKMTDKERAELYQKQEESRQRAEKLEEEERDRRRRDEKHRKEEDEKKT